MSGGWRLHALVRACSSGRTPRRNGIDFFPSFFSLSALPPSFPPSPPHIGWSSWSFLMSTLAGGSVLDKSRGAMPCSTCKAKKRAWSGRGFHLPRSRASVGAAEKTAALGRGARGGSATHALPWCRPAAHSFTIVLDVRYTEV